MCSRLSRVSKTGKNKTISRSTTCYSIFDSNKLEFCYENCRLKLDILTHSRKKKKLCNKNKYLSKRCSYI